MPSVAILMGEWQEGGNFRRGQSGLHGKGASQPKALHSLGHTHFQGLNSSAPSNESLCNMNAAEGGRERQAALLTNQTDDASPTHTTLERKTSKAHKTRRDAAKEPTDRVCSRFVPAKNPHCALSPLQHGLVASCRPSKPCYQGV